MNNEQIKEKIANKREVFKLLALIMLAVATGIVTNVYQILVHKAPLFTLVLSLIGLLINLQLAIILKTISQEIDELIRKLS